MVRVLPSGDEERRMKSRNLWIGLMVLVVVTLAMAPPSAFAQDVPKIDVKISDGDSPIWYKNPIVIGGGVLALLLIAVLAGRGGGTTVVKS
jgi:hypothetical protein